jgi:hypothetical protein
VWQVGPRIRCEDRTLVAETSFFVKILTLGFSSRRVVIDAGAEKIRVSARRFWFFESTQDYFFEEIEKIDYDYEDLMGELSYVRRLHDSIDCYNVRLRLKTGGRVHLFSFIGEGDVVNDGIFPDWYTLLKAGVEFCGQQDRESLVFAEFVKEMTGATLS